LSITSTTAHCLLKKNQKLKVEEVSNNYDVLRFEILRVLTLFKYIDDIECFKIVNNLEMCLEENKKYKNLLCFLQGHSNTKYIFSITDKKFACFGDRN
jgi:hypothetical protein